MARRHLVAHLFHHVHIKAKDPRKTARWWVDVFGAKPLPERDMAGALFVPVELGGVTINISSPRPEEADLMGEGDASLHYGLEHLGLYTDDLDKDLARLRKQRLQVFETRESPASKMAFVETPDKVRVELIQPLG